MSDALLLLGNTDAKLSALLSKMGYNVTVSEKADSLAEVVRSNLYDLVLLDSQVGPEWPDLCHFLRSESATSAVPIVCLSSDQSKNSELKQEIDNLEFVDLPYSVGSVVSRIAMQLRLRKFNGTDNTSARLGEVNAALRDLNDRFMAQLNEARQIQESLLPESLPSDARFDMAVAYQPLEGVGGDWYSVRKEPSGMITAQIADATGHGLSAAFLCAMTKLARCAADHPFPDEVLTEMNRLMSPVLPEGKFVTLCSYHYDPATGKLYFARAGHPCALVVKRSEGRVVQLQTNGFALGFLDDAVYARDELQLEPNDLILIYTDGVTEAQNMNSELYGVERLSAVLLASKPEAHSAEVLQSVFDDFETFRDGRLLKDDVTAIVLKRSI
ncbi:MAG: fused response regulator/phosphatase [Oligoflexia bacterium]|nr:fused response regulator/phosphatase [Oligoflexia bacterium]